MTSMFGWLGSVICFLSIAASVANAQSFAPARPASDNFGWGDAAGEWSADEHPRLMGDVNGDDLADVVGFGGRGVWVALGQPDGSFAPSVQVLGNFGAGPSGGSWGRSDGQPWDITRPRHLADINGDGRDDIVGFGDRGVWVSLALADSPFGEMFDVPTMVLPRFGSLPEAGGWVEVKGQGHETYPRLLGDVDGDGRADIVGFGEDGVYVSLSQGGGSFTERVRVLRGFGAAPSAGGWDGYRHPRRLGDVNGDLRADIVGFGESGTMVSLGQEDGTFSEPSLVLRSFGAGEAAGSWGAVTDVDGAATEYPRLLGDVNGDGRSDIVGFGNRATWVSLGQLDGSLSEPVRVLDYFGAARDAGGFQSYDDVRAVADVNGDGRDDIVGMGLRDTEVSLSRDDGTFSAPVVALDDFGRATASDNYWSNREPRLLADVDGDGRADIIGFDEEGTVVSLAQRVRPGADDVAADPDQELLDVPHPRARFTWRMLERYAAAWDAYDAETRTYDQRYVHPDNWSVVVDACASTGDGAEIQNYRVELRGVGFDYRRRVTRDYCFFTIDTLPQLGTYRLSVDLQTEFGWSDPTSEEIRLVDWLIVSLGDSFASGEGNPDQPGWYVLNSLGLFSPSQASLRDEDLTDIREGPAIWQDEDCHRSARSGHAQAAEELERRDPHSSVTFLSFACTGARAYDMTGGPAFVRCYFLRRQQDCGEGATPSGRKAQLVSLFEHLSLLEGRSPEDVRDVDVVFLSVGINEFEFSSLIYDCAHPRYSYRIDVCVESYEARLFDLPRQWRLIDRVFESLPGDPEIYLADYPGNLLHGGGCGKLDTFGLGISSDDGRDIADLGFNLNRDMARVSNVLGWNFVYGMTEAFQGRHYCAEDSYFRYYTDSLWTQGDKSGTLHPNGRGHQVYRDLLLESVVLAPSFEPWQNVRLVIEQVRLNSGGRSIGDSYAPQVVVVVKTDQDDTIGDRSAGLQRRYFPVDRLDEWIDVPASEGTFDFGLYLQPVPPRYPTTVFIEAGGTSGEGVWRDHFRLEDSFGAGDHEGQDRQFAILYHIEITGTSAACPALVAQSRLPGLEPSAVAPIPCEYIDP